MNKLLLSLLVLLPTASTFAAETPCDHWGYVSEMIMKARQQGIDYETMSKVVRGNPLATFIVNDAYRQPIYDTLDGKTSAVSAFKIVNIISCVKAQKGLTK